MQENWKPVLGFEEQYEVSDLGNIRSLIDTRGKKRLVPALKKPYISPLKGRGYREFKFWFKNKSYSKRASRLVLETFVGPCPVEKEASHINGVRTDDRLLNLVWESRKENHHRKKQHGTSQCGEASGVARFTDKQVIKIRSLYQKSKRGGWNTVALAKKYKVNQGTIHCIISRKTWRHLP